MKKLIALMALASMFAVGCAHNKGGTSDSNYSTSDTSTGEKGKMQDNANQPSSQSTTTSTNSNSSTPQQQ
jgi:hypothetical protein